MDDESMVQRNQLNGVCPLFRHGVLIDDVMAISRLKLEAEDRALILGADAGGG